MKLAKMQAICIMMPQASRRRSKEVGKIDAFCPGGEGQSESLVEPCTVNRGKRIRSRGLGNERERRSTGPVGSGSHSDTAPLSTWVSAGYIPLYGGRSLHGDVRRSGRGHSKRCMLP